MIQRIGLFLAIFLGAACASEAAIARVSSTIGTGTSVSITTPSKGNLILVCAYNDAAATAPTLATGYTNISNATGNTNGLRCGYLISAGTETTSGTWTNATDIGVDILSGQDRAPIGGLATGGASSATIAYNTFTLTRGDTSSWIIGFAGNRTALVATAPTNLVKQQSQTRAILSDSNGTLNSWSTQTVGGNTNTGWRSLTFEVRAAESNTTDPANLIQYCIFQPNMNSGGVGSDHVYHFPFPHPSGAGDLIQVNLVYPYSATRTVTVTDDQSQTYSTALTPVSDAGPYFTVGVWYFANTAASVHTITVTFDANNIFNVGASIIEWTGLATSSVIVGSSSSTTAVDPEVQAGNFTPSSYGTNGALIYQIAMMNANGNNNLLSLGTSGGFMGGNGFSLLGSNRNAMIADEAQLIASGSINPAISALQLTAGDVGSTWNTVAVAFKTDNTKGTALPSGVRIIRAIHAFGDNGSGVWTAQQLEFPGQGTFALATSSFPTVNGTLASITDSDSNSWTVKSPSTSAYSQMAYTYNVAASNRRLITFNLTSPSEGFEITMYDVVGIKATGDPYLQKVETTYNQVGGSTLTFPTSITPTTTGNLIVATNNNGTGPISGLTSPSSGVLLNDTYPNQTDAGSDSGDSYSYAIAPSTSALSWVLTINNGAATQTSQLSLWEFAKAPAAAGGTCNSRMLLKVGC